MKGGRWLGICVVVGLSSIGWSWVDTGHMIVAAVAEARLTPAAKKAATRLLAGIDDRRSSTFITASCWADDTKSDQDRAWHYCDFHFRADGKPSDLKPEDENVVWAIKVQSNILIDGVSSLEQKSAALRYLIHFVGDVHQPLHAIARDSDEFPEGDRGGNDFKIKPINGWGNRPVSNLHTLWDFACGAYKSSPKRPLVSADEQWIRDRAAEFAKPYPYAKMADVKLNDPMVWAKESFSLRNVVYNLEEKETPSDEYLAKGSEICRKRIVRAGYRLADLLNRLLK